MSYDNQVQCITTEAGADLSTKQYLFVSMASDGQVDPTGDGLNAIGVLQNKPDAAGKAATVAYAGVSKVIAGGVIAAGGAVSSDADGKAVAAGTGDVILGVALSVAAANDVIPVLLQAR